MNFKFTNPTIKELIADFYLNNPEVTNFEKNCNEFFEYLDTLPKTIELKSRPKTEWEELVFIDRKKAYFELQEETNEQIKFAWAISGFKINKLLTAILELLDRGNTYPAFSLTRTLMEVCCSTNYTLTKAKPHIRALNDCKNDFYQYHFVHEELEEILNRGIRGTKNPVVKKEFTDSFEATRITEAIKEVSKKKKYSDMYAKYSILCDYTHPNMFSNSVFGIITKIYHDKEIKTYPEAKLAAYPGEMELFFLNPPKGSEKMMVTYLGLLFSIIDKNMDLFEETVEEFKGVKVAGFNTESTFWEIDSLTENQKKEMLEKYRSEIKKKRSSITKK